ncbi:hypothetical protein PLICRDRAFT_100826 [Plicaturopsis crispa FD-325 SS-3]|nr:hypothetical protein PLICRDRAFT_100826 [Plicaturopsis crispa FD-325 SS-3]
MEHEQTGPDDEKRSTTSTPNDNEGASKNEDDVRRQDEAAKHIQRVWKQRKKTFMNTDVRWDDAATHTKMKIDRDGQDQGKNDPRARWKRAKFLASRLQDGNQMLSGVGVHDDGAVKKSLETQHWLEMVDAYALLQ